MSQWRRSPRGGPEQSLCAGATVECRRNPDRDLGVRKEDTSRPSLSLEVVHTASSQALRPRRWSGAWARVVPQMLASWLQEADGRPWRGVHRSRCLSRCLCSRGPSEGNGDGSWNPITPRAPQRAPRFAPLSGELCGLPAPWPGLGASSLEAWR